MKTKTKKYLFWGIVGVGAYYLFTSRATPQTVSGLGFLGGGVGRFAAARGLQRTSSPWPGGKLNWNLARNQYTQLAPIEIEQINSPVPPATWISGRAAAAWAAKHPNVSPVPAGPDNSGTYLTTTSGYGGRGEQVQSKYGFSRK